MSRRCAACSSTRSSTGRPNPIAGPRRWRDDPRGARDGPRRRVGLMAGPNLAREGLGGFAAAAVIATADDSVAQALQPLFRTTNFRVYRNLDLLGSELGGVLKNIIAIASGMADGLGVGDNTRALVITRGLAEMTRLGEAMGAEARTFMGLT